MYDLTSKQLLVGIGRGTIFFLLVFTANEMSVEKLRKMPRYLLVGHSFADFQKPIGFLLHLYPRQCFTGSYLANFGKKATRASLYTPMHVLSAAFIFLSSLHAWWRPTLRYKKVSDPTFTHLPIFSGFFFNHLQRIIGCYTCRRGESCWSVKDTALQLAPNAKVYLNGSMRKGTKRHFL